MRCLTVIILFTLSTCTCVVKEKNGFYRNIAVFGWFTNYYYEEIKEKAIKLQTNMSHIETNLKVLNQYIQLQSHLEGKLDLCLNGTKTRPDRETTKKSTELYVTTSTEEYFETTEKPHMKTVDYIETTEVPTESDMTTEEYFEPTERPHMKTTDYIEITDVYFEPTEKPAITTEDYPEITETSIFSTIEDYPEDITNCCIQPPTEIPIETMATTIEPWIDTTSSIRTEPWWVEPPTKRHYKTRSTRSTSTRHTHYHRISTRRPRRTTKRSRPTRRLASTMSRHTHYHRTPPTRRPRPTKRAWTIKKFTMIYGRH